MHSLILNQFSSQTNVGYCLLFILLQSDLSFSSSHNLPIFISVPCARLNWQFSGSFQADVKLAYLILYLQTTTIAEQSPTSQRRELYNKKQEMSGAAVRRRTRDRKVVGSTPGRGAIKSTRSTQPSIPPG